MYERVRVCPNCDGEFRPEIELCPDCRRPLSLVERYGAEIERYGAEVERNGAEEPLALPRPDPAEPVVALRMADVFALSFLNGLVERLWEAGVASRIESTDPSGYVLLVGEADHERASQIDLEYYREEVPDAAAVIDPGSTDRCPACGARVGQSATGCPDCGLEFPEDEPTAD